MNDILKHQLPNTFRIHGIYGDATDLSARA